MCIFVWEHVLLSELRVAPVTLAWIWSVFLKVFLDLVALHLPQLGSRNGTVGWLQVIPFTMMIMMQLLNNHRLPGILREYWWGEKDRGEGCWRHRLVSSAEQFSCPLLIQVFLICCGFKVHLLCICRGQGWEHIVLPLPFSYLWINILPAAG